MISISHSPNSNRRQLALCFNYLLNPFKWRFWRSGNDIKTFEQAFAKYQGTNEAVSFQNGRESFYAILQALGIQKGDEIIIQSFTCIVIPNAIRWIGATPIYADVDKSLNIDCSHLQHLITQKTKAVVVQHTFGIPADISKIRKLCDEQNILLIEDCAHSLGAKVGGQLVGTFGDAAFFSFGRDKVISSVSGGIACFKNPLNNSKLRMLQNNAPLNSRRFVFQNLLHPLLLPWMARYINRVKIGQALIAFAQKTRLLNRVYSKNDVCSQSPQTTLHRMPNAMAAMALQQFEELDAMNQHRAKIARKYQSFCDEHGIGYQSWHGDTMPVFLRFTIFTERRKHLLSQARKAGYLLGDWYTSPIMPRPVSYDLVHYEAGCCTRAQHYASVSVNLPTHRKIGEKEVREILHLLKNHYDH